MKIKLSPPMNPLELRIMEKIHKEGPITFETFMEMALYEPGLGYYAADDIEIGRAGDFYTSEHVHPAFGAMIARQLEEMWEILDRPSDFCAVEPGAGAGLMCMDIMDYLKNRDIFDSLTYVIVEINLSVRQKQERLLKKYPGQVKWVHSLKDVGRIRGCILSNELLDAFPVHLVQVDGELSEIYVGIDQRPAQERASETTPLNPPLVRGEKKGGALERREEKGGVIPRAHFSESKGSPSTPALSDYLSEFSIALSRGYHTEINLRIKDWLKNISDVLSEGFILTVDYGYPSREYYSEERNRGTLLCYYQHRVNENPYVNIGKQDITAHVNFSSVKKWGEEYGLRTIGFCPQGTYLISLGIDGIINKLYANSPDYLFEVAKIKRLIFPGTLGETHKVLVQYKGKGNPTLRGFSVKNQTDRL